MEQETNEPDDQLEAPPTEVKRRVGRPTNAELAAKRAEQLKAEKEFPELAVRRMQKLFMHVLDISDTKLERIAPGQLPMAIGILWDKINNYQARGITLNQTNVTINNLSRESALALLQGKELPVSVAKSAPLHAIETRSQVIRAPETIDLDPAPEKGTI
jgi:hypothetical protein